MLFVRVVRPVCVVLGLGIIAVPHTDGFLSSRPAPPAEIAATDRAHVEDRFGKLPLSFVENRNQVDERVAYTARGLGHNAYFTADGLTLRLARGKGDDAKAHTIKVELVGAATERIES